MKQSMAYVEVVLVTCAWFMGSTALAKPWWKNPVIKYSENTGVAFGSTDPHYMNKDESDQYLFVPLNSSGGTDQLYSIPALISATSSNDVAPIAQGIGTDFWGATWKGGAVSDDLKRAITGNGLYSGGVGSPLHTSFPLTAPWTKDVTAFCITNQPTTWASDGMDFSHTSEFLFSNVYNTPEWNKIVKWNVTNLLSGGIGLVSNTVFTTSLSRVRNVSDYYIGGKDLVYYGEGNDTLGVTPRKVCVYDPDLGTETELVTLNRTNETGVLAADVDVMNVKVGGVGLGQMHLYVQCNDGTLYIYNLNADGKSVGTLARTFSVTEMKVLLGVGATGNLGPSDRIRCLEFTNDEKYGFLCHKANSGNTLLHVLWTQPAEIPWWQVPRLKYKENTGVNNIGPHYMNKDESDQYLFLPLGTALSMPGQLYSIPALIAATSSNGVAPIVSGLPSSFYGNWKGGAISDDLLRVLTGSAGTPIMENSSLPLTAPWTKNVTVFDITNSPTTVQFDSLDFSHTSEYLYSDYYTTGYQTKLYKWNVVNLTSNGVGLTSNAVYNTSIVRVRTVNVYYIGGKDLLYYGEGTGGNKVCVYDPDAQAETVLISGGMPVTNDIMNVKLGGVGLGQMHLYVQHDNGALCIYDLGEDGKSAGPLVRYFSREQIYALLGSTPVSNMRCFEVTNDERYAFFSHHTSGGAVGLLYVVWAPPQELLIEVR